MGAIVRTFLVFAFGQIKQYLPRVDATPPGKYVAQMFVSSTLPIVLGGLVAFPLLMINTSAIAFFILFRHGAPLLNAQSTRESSHERHCTITD